MMEKQTDTSQILASLQKGLQEFLKGDTQRYVDYLHMMSRFHRYSYNNVLLIYQQMPDAQLVNSYTGWRKIGRYVKRGEKAIQIIAPVIVQEEPEKDLAEKAKSQESPKRIYFRVAKVFDVSQTGGKELPLPDAPELTGDVPDYRRVITAVSNLSPVPVRYDILSGGTKGYYHRGRKEIVVQKGMSQLQTVKTLIHEIAHAKLHDQETGRLTKEARETEAESIAYVVCQALGLDTADYTFPYLASWSKNHDLRELKNSLAVIRDTADDCIRQMQEQLKTANAV